MKVSFTPDTHFGVYDQDEPPTPDEAADGMDHRVAGGRRGWRAERRDG